MPNLTLSIDADLLKRARKISIERDKSLTALIRDFLEELVRHEELRDDIAAVELDRLFTESTAVVGRRSWTRDKLHER